jgi:hypothetical protein
MALYQASIVLPLRHQITCGSFQSMPTMFGHHYGSLDVVLSPNGRGLSMSTYQVPLPSLMTMAPQIAIFFVYEDFFHYLGNAFFWLLDVAFR